MTGSSLGGFSLIPLGPGIPGQVNDEAYGTSLPRKEIRVADKEDDTEAIIRRGLLDHRRPIFQGGNDTKNNLQIFCEVCNNQKNSICRKCPYEYKCDACVWAHPEKSRTNRLIIDVDTNTYDRLTRVFGEETQKAVKKAIKDLAFGRNS